MSTSVHFLLQVNEREEEAGNGFIQRTCTRRARKDVPAAPIVQRNLVSASPKIKQGWKSGDTNHLLG